MEQEKFKPGDIARLISGGPNMTVSQLPFIGADGVLFAHLHWFEGSELHGGSMPVTSLQHSNSF